MITVSVPRVGMYPCQPRIAAVGETHFRYVPTGYFVDAFVAFSFGHEPEQGIAKGVAERLAKELREAAEQSLSRMKAEGLI